MIGGVPQIGFSPMARVGFGSYNGYPQDFKENVYTYSDMVSIGHGNHNMKVGADFRRNIENSEFNVARPSYYFYDQVGFAADAPYYQAAGVDPGICKAPCPVSAYNPTPNGDLSDNIRHWRNLEFGAYFQDDWKVTKRLTLNLGLRYDLYQRHHEEANVATTFILGPNTPNSFSTGTEQRDSRTNCTTPTIPATMCANSTALAQLVGGCRRQPADLLRRTVSARATTITLDPALVLHGMCLAMAKLHCAAASALPTRAHSTTRCPTLAGISPTTRSTESVAGLNSQQVPT